MLTSGKIHYVSTSYNYPTIYQVLFLNCDVFCWFLLCLFTVLSSIIYQLLSLGGLLDLLCKIQHFWWLRWKCYLLQGAVPAGCELRTICEEFFFSHLQIASECSAQWISFNIMYHISTLLWLWYLDHVLIFYLSCLTLV